MKIVLTLFLLATSTFALVDENIPTANAVESQKTDLIIKTNNGQTFSINADGKNGRSGTRKLHGDDDDDEDDESSSSLPVIDEDYVEEVSNAVTKFNRAVENPRTEGELCMSEDLAHQIQDLLNDYQEVAEDILEEASESESSSGWREEYSDHDSGDGGYDSSRKLKAKHHKRRHVRALSSKGSSTHRKLGRRDNHRRHRRHLRILKKDALKNKVNKI